MGWYDTPNQFNPENRFIGDIEDGKSYPYACYTKDESDERYAIKQDLVDLASIVDEKADETEAEAIRARLGKTAITYRSVAAMKADAALTAGDVVETNEYHAGGGGGARYEIIEAEENASIEDDDFTLILLNNGLYAQLLSIKDCGYIDIRWAGAYNTMENIDSSAAFQKAVHYSNANYITPIRVIGNYYIGNTINMIGSLCLRGEHIASSRYLVGKANFPGSTKHSPSKIRIASNITAFNITGMGSESSTGARASSLDIRGLEITGDSSAIFMDIHAYGAPSRPSLIENCEIHNINTFFKSIWDNENHYGALIYNLDVRNNNVYNCTKLFDVKGQNGTTPSLGGLNIHDNVIEQGVGMRILNMFGNNYITNNLMEGTTENIELTCNKGSIDFSGNYFEASSGTVSLKSYGAKMDVFIDSIYYWNCPNLLFDLYNVYLQSCAEVPNLKLAVADIYQAVADRIPGKIKFNNTLSVYGIWFPRMTEVKKIDEGVRLSAPVPINLLNQRIIYYPESNTSFFYNYTSAAPINGIKDDLVNLCFWKPAGKIDLLEIANADTYESVGIAVADICAKSGFYSITIKLTADMPRGAVIVKAPNGIGTMIFRNITQMDAENSSILTTAIVENPDLTFEYVVSGYGINLKAMPTIDESDGKIYLTSSNPEIVDDFTVYKSESYKRWGDGEAYTEDISGNEGDYINISFWKPEGNVDISLIDAEGRGGYGLALTDVYSHAGFYSVTFKLTQSISSGAFSIVAPNGIGNITYTNVTNSMNRIITDVVKILK